jgi:hypothetical protein
LYREVSLLIHLKIRRDITNPEGRISQDMTHGSLVANDIDYHSSTAMTADEETEYLREHLMQMEQDKISREFQPHTTSTCQIPSPEEPISLELHGDRHNEERPTLSHRTHAAIIPSLIRPGILQYVKRKEVGTDPQTHSISHQLPHQRQPQQLPESQRRDSGYCSMNSEPEITGTEIERCTTPMTLSRRSTGLSQASGPPPPYSQPKHGSAGDYFNQDIYYDEPVLADIKGTKKKWKWDAKSLGKRISMAHF